MARSGKGSASFSRGNKLGVARAREFALVSDFKYGYRNKEDISNLPPQTLVVGSQNVLTNVANRLQNRQGYILDGASSDVLGPVLASFDWQTRGNGERHMRAGGLTSAGDDGKLQYRYVDSDDNITWRDLITGLSSVLFNFTSFWNDAESVREALFVNGESQIQAWNGALATLASADNTAGHIAELNSTPTNGGSGYTVGDVLTITAAGVGGTATVVSVDGSGAITAVSLTTTGSGYSTGSGKATSGGTGSSATLNITTVDTGQIVINGTDSVLDSGFYTTDNLNIVINGTTYSYNYVVGTSFIGIAPSAAAEPVDSVIHQAVVTTINSDMSGITDTFANGLIRALNNQVFVGALNSSVLWISKINDYTDYTSSTPRQAGEGASLILDGQLVALQPQEQFMYVSAGQNLWYNVNFELQTSTVGITYEQVNAELLNVGVRQGAISQAFVSHIKNDLIMATQETTIDTFGRIESSLATPQTTNLSDPIKVDIDSYDFTDGSLFYWRYYILVAVPQEGVVRIYNLANKFWEAPQVLPISRFYVVEGELYGHSYNTFESYKLFEGYNDNGNPIYAVAAFPYVAVEGGAAFEKKNFNEIYTEGYISSNTTLMLTVNYDFGGFTGTYTTNISGADRSIIFNKITDGSLGQSSLGSQPVGTILNLPPGSDVPKFRVINTMPRQNIYEGQLVYASNEIDQNWQLLRFGPGIAAATDRPVEITQ